MALKPITSGTNGTMSKRIEINERRTPVRMRRRVDPNEVYVDLQQGFRPVDVARKYQITRQRVYQIKDEIEQRASHAE